MILYVLFGLRVAPDLDAYAPEALEVMGEYDYDDNSQWLHEKMGEYEATKDFTALRIVRVDLGKGAEENIRQLLVGFPEISGSVGEPVSDEKE